MMPNESRADILARLRGSASGLSNNDILRAQWALGHAPHPTLSSDDNVQALLTNVLNNQGTVDCAESRVDVVKAVAKYLYEKLRSHRLVASNDARLAALPFRDGGLLPRFGSVEGSEPVSLSYAQLAVAELGAVVTFTGKANPAANNLLPEHHIVLVDARDVVATSENAWQKIDELCNTGGRPRGINFIAGPSSTADIEGQLVYGAHGPRSWHVIVVGEVSQGSLRVIGQEAGKETITSKGE